MSTPPERTKRAQRLIRECGRALISLADEVEETVKAEKRGAAKERAAVIARLDTWRAELNPNQHKHELELIHSFTGIIERGEHVAIQQNKDITAQQDENKNTLENLRKVMALIEAGTLREKRKVIEDPPGSGHFTMEPYGTKDEI